MKIVSILAAILFATHLMAGASGLTKKTGVMAPVNDAVVVAPADTAALAREKAIVCAACHGEDGNSPNGAYPILAGQTSRYLYLQLKDYKEGRRKDPVMSAMAVNLSKEDLRALADYFASRKPKSNGFSADEAKAGKGKAVADAALCTMCHLGGFSGQNEIPRVGGQHFDYIVKQLKDFRARNRTNDAGNMTSVSKGLSDDDIENLAHYIAGLN